MERRPTPKGQGSLREEPLKEKLQRATNKELWMREGKKKGNGV